MTTLFIANCKLLPVYSEGILEVVIAQGTAWNHVTLIRNYCMPLTLILKGVSSHMRAKFRKVTKNKYECDVIYKG